MRYESDKALAFLPCVIENASINCPFLFSEANKSETTHFQRAPLKTHQPTPF